VSDVWVAGAQLLRSGVLTRMDETALCEKVAHWQARISTGLGGSETAA
jgi:hypothetical protein